MTRKILTFSAIILLTGCATMFGDSADQITIHSNDPNAKILINGNEIGTGQATYSLPRGKTAIITATEPGCSDRSMPTDETIDGNTWLNILVWPGFLVDAATGNIHKAGTTDYTVTPDCHK